MKGNVLKAQTAFLAVSSSKLTKLAAEVTRLILFRKAKLAVCKMGQSLLTSAATVLDRIPGFGLLSVFRFRPSDYDFSRLFALAYLSLLLLPAVAAPLPAAKPNIVFILADDLGDGDVQCLNPQRGKIKTPNLDRLAAQGMTFTDAHSGSSVCTPTRYGVLTGRYAWRTRLQRGVLDGYVPPLIARDRLTVPALLKQHGYHTACLGKWHLGFTIEGAGKRGGGAKGRFEGAPLGAVTHDGPLTHGFDYFYGFHHARMMKSAFENDRVTEIVEPVDMLPRLTRQAVGYITARARTGQPFFLYLALNSPHTPIVPSKEWQGKSGLGKYGDFVMETDWAVREVLAALDQTGVATNTLVIFTSDNGCSPAAGTARLERQGHFASAQFRGYKSDIWDGGHRVPFFVRWPGKVKPGAHSDQLICHTDLMATCADLLGTQLPDNTSEDSVSFLPALLGEDRAPLREAVVHHSINGRFALRQGRWKLEFCPGSGGWSQPGDAAAKMQGLPAVQLYDLTADIGETNNVQAEHPDVVARLTKLLEQYIANGRSTPGARQTNDVTVNAPWHSKGLEDVSGSKPFGLFRLDVSQRAEVVERRLPPHPSPLPQGEGAPSAALIRYRRPPELVTQLLQIEPHLNVALHWRFPLSGEREPLRRPSGTASALSGFISDAQILKQAVTVALQPKIPAGSIAFPSPWGEGQGEGNRRGQLLNGSRSSQNCQTLNALTQSQMFSANSTNPLP